MTATRALPVPQPALFAAQAQDLVSVDHGQAVTTSRRVAEYFGKRHRDVLRSIQALIEQVEPDFTERSFALSDYADATGRTLPEYQITQAGFALLAMGFTGAEALRLKVRFIRAFETTARELQRLKAQRLDPTWKASRTAVAQQHSAVNAVLVEVRRSAGKHTEAHHLANEARLIGYALTGVHAGLDRETLDVAQLRLLHQVECRDVILLAQGAGYEARKAALRALVLAAADTPDAPARLTDAHPTTGRTA
ncbi:MAG: hypothetical protein RIQ60_3589 [Pseudomonadota bacterium]|jgi:Rha family phage regulatory protein